MYTCLMIFMLRENQLPKQRGIYQEIQNPNSTITTQGIIERIIENRVK